MENKKIRNIFLVLFFICFTFPKINLINLPGISTGIRIDDLIALFFFLYIVFKNWKQFRNNKIFKLKKINSIFIIYIIFCIISLIIGTINGFISFYIGLLFVIRKIEYFIFIYVGYEYFKLDKEFKKIKLCFSIMIVFHFIVSILQLNGIFGSFNAGSYINYLTQGRVSSTFNGAYEFSAFMLFCLPYVLYEVLYLKTNKLTNCIINFSLIIIIMSSIIISESRTSLIIAVLIIFIMIIKKIFYNNKIAKAIKISFIPLFILFILFSCIFFKNINYRLKNLNFNEFNNSISCAWKYKSFDSYKKTGNWYTSTHCFKVKADESFNLRINHWMQLIDGVIEHPLFGLGPSITTAAADGNYVRILSESGVFGLLIWIIMLAYIFKILRKQSKNNYIMKLCFITLILGAILIDIFEASKIMMLFWFFLGYTINSNIKKKELKNVIIVNDFNYIQGGASKVAIETAEILKKDYNVVFFSAVNIKEQNISGIKYVCTNQQENLKCKNKLIGAINGIYNFKASKAMKRLLMNFDTEETIIHMHGWTKALSSSVFRYPLNNDFKVVITLHDYFTVCPNGGFFNYKKNIICKLNPNSFKCITCNCDSRNKKFKFYRLIRQFIQDNIVGLKRKLEYAIGISDLNINVLEKHLNKNIIIKKVLNPIDFKLEKKLDITKNEFYLYIGRVTKEKGVELICEASKKFKYPLVVVGDGSELEELSKKYQDVKFVGWKSNKEVKEYIKKARILLFPSLWYEGAPLTPLEAMNFGVPCLVSNCSSAIEYISDNGKIFDPYENNSLEYGVKEIEQNLKKYSLNSYKYIKNLRKNNYKKELIKFYNSME